VRARVHAANWEGIFRVSLVEIALYLVAALWAFTPVLFVRSPRRWLSHGAILLLLTWPIGVWDIAVEHTGFATMFAMLMGPFLGPITLVSWLLRGGLAGYVGITASVAILFWLYLKVFEGTKSRQAAFASALGIALGGGYMTATIATSLGQYAQATWLGQTNICITRKPLVGMIKTARTYPGPRAPFATLTTPTVKFNWSISDYKWIAPIADPTAPKAATIGKYECKPLLLQTF
jgi:hypothetical protein